jgi:hypothetical protein
MQVITWQFWSLLGKMPSTQKKWNATVYTKKLYLLLHSVFLCWRQT